MNNLMQLKDEDAKRSSSSHTSGLRYDGLGWSKIEDPNDDIDRRRPKIDQFFAEVRNTELREECFRLISLLCAAQEPLPLVILDELMGVESISQLKDSLSFFIRSGDGGKTYFLDKFLAGQLFQFKHDDHFKTDISNRINHLVFDDYIKQHRDAHLKIYCVCQNAFLKVGGRRISGASASSKKMHDNNSLTVKKLHDNDKLKNKKRLSLFQRRSWSNRSLSSRTESERSFMEPEEDSYDSRRQTYDEAYESNDFNISNLASSLDIMDQDFVNYAWKYSVIHACESGCDNQLDIVRKNQLLNLDWLVEKVGKLGPSKAIGDIERFCEKRKDDRPIHLIKHALQLSFMALRKDCRELPSQLVGGRLQMLHEDMEFMEIVKLLEDAKLYRPRTLRTGERNVEGSSETKSYWMPVTKCLLSPGNQCQVIMRGHVGSVNAVKISREGNKMYSGGSDTSVKKWDVKTGMCLMTMIGHVSSVLAVDISYDGLIVYSGSADNTVRSWNALTGVNMLTMREHKHSVCTVCISKNGQIGCSGCSQGTVRMWDAITGVQLQLFSGHKYGVKSVVISNDASLIFSGSCDEGIRVWNATSGECTGILLDHTGDVNTLCVSEDGTMLFSGSDDKKVNMWETIAWQMVQSFVGHSGRVLSVSLTHDGKQVISGSDDNTIKMWHVSSGACVNTFRGHGDTVKSVCISLDNVDVFSASKDGTVRVWDSEGNDNIKSTNMHICGVWWVQFNRKGTRLLSRGRDGKYFVWDCTTGKCQYSSIVKPPLSLFNSVTARAKYDWRCDDSEFNEEEAGFSGDIRLDRKVHFYNDTKRRRSKACYVDCNEVHILSHV